MVGYMTFDMRWMVKRGMVLKRGIIENVKDFRAIKKEYYFT